MKNSESARKRKTRRQPAGFPFKFSPLLANIVSTACAGIKKTRPTRVNLLSGCLLRKPEVLALVVLTLSGKETAFS
jgi:hypothetical protein